MITYAMLPRQITLPKPLFDFYHSGFDHLTNPFLRKSRVFTSIQNPRGVTLTPERMRRGASFRSSQLVCLLSHPCNPCRFMRLRTLLRDGQPPNHSISMGYALFPSRQGVVPLPDGARFRKGVPTCVGARHSRARLPVLAPSLQGAIFPPRRRRGRTLR